MLLSSFSHSLSYKHKITNLLHCFYLLSSTFAFSGFNFQIGFYWAVDRQKDETVLALLQIIIDIQFRCVQWPESIKLSTHIHCWLSKFRHEWLFNSYESYFYI